MADRIVYLVTKVTPVMEREAAISFIDDAGLSVLVGDGWEVVSSTEREVSVGSRKIKATMMILRRASDNRGLATVERPDRSEGAQIVTRDEYGRSRTVTITEAITGMVEGMGRALARVGESGHLGAAGDHNLPGISIVSGSVVQKAFDVGVTAGRQRQDRSMCPFPAGSAPARQWLQGYDRGRGEAPPAGEEVLAAFNAGVRDAKAFAEEDVVDCPYPPGSQLREHWIRGFKSAGGRVEE